MEGALAAVDPKANQAQTGVVSLESVRLHYSNHALARRYQIMTVP